MAREIHLTWQDLKQRADKFTTFFRRRTTPRPVSLYGIPRGGVYAALLVSESLSRCGFFPTIVEDPKSAELWVDDIRDTGATLLAYKKKYNPSSMVSECVLVDRLGEDACDRDIWFVFPWERLACECGPGENVTRMLQFIGEDPKREGLVETPKRVVRSWEKLFGGYKQNPEQFIKTFKDGACNEMVVVRDVEFYSTCEHHLLPFFGKAHLGYLPGGKVIGVSKLVRLLEVFARRLQIQERIGQQVTDTLMKTLAPMGCGCILQAQHFCMTSRGVEKQNSVMVTASLRGNFLEDDKVKQEFYRMSGL